MFRFAGLTERICEEAFTLVWPSIRDASINGTTNKPGGSLLVVHMNMPYRSDLNFENHMILFEQAMVPETHDPKYTEIARAKAQLSWRTGLPSRVVQQESPHLYTGGDVKWGGSVVRNGLIVAFSGVQAVFDEMIAGWMADAIIGICRHEMTKEDGVMASESSFIGRN